MASRTAPSFWVFIILLAVFHFVLRVAIGLSVSAPDLLTIAVLLAARRLKGSQAAGVGLVLGLLVDGLALTTFGALALVNAVVGFLGARSRDLFEGDSYLFIGAYIFLGKLVHDVLYFVITKSSHGQEWSALLTPAPLAALYAAVAAIIAIILYSAATGDR